MVYAVCTSGLGNKIATIVGGMYWAEQLNTSLKIVWSPDDECDCKFTDIFEPYGSVISLKEFEKELRLVNNVAVAGFLEQSKQLQHYISHNKDLNKQAAAAFLSLLNPDELNKQCLINKTLIYNSIAIPPYINEQHAITALTKLKINKSILSKVKLFITLHNIDKHTKGLLLRKTDGAIIFKSISDSKYLRSVKQDIKSTYFITSDDRATERTFKMLPNVVTFPKISYVDFNKETGKLYRSKQSVIEGFISLLILSRTSLVKVENCESSFYKTAILYQNVKI